MFDAVRSILRPQVVSLVDHGRAFCPVSGRDADIDYCMACTFLADFTANEAGVITEIACTPAFRALVADSL